MGSSEEQDEAFRRQPKSLDCDAVVAAAMRQAELTVLLQQGGI